MTVLSLSSFAKGVLGPQLYGRVDSKMYKLGLRQAHNCIIHPYGGVSNRPGTLCIALPKKMAHADAPWMFRFHLGTTDQYVLEFGNLYMRVVRNDKIVTETVTTITGATQANPVVITSTAHGYSNGDDLFLRQTTGMLALDKRRVIVRNKTDNTYELEDLLTGSATDGTSFGAFASGGTLTAGKIFELATPYTLVDVPTLRQVQNGNTITITHLNYEPRDLTRTDHNVWALATLSSLLVPGLSAPTALGISTDKDTNFQVFESFNQTVRYKVTAIIDVEGRFEESLPTTTTTFVSSDPPLNTITWAVVTGADRYAVYRQDNGVYGLLGETELLTFLDKNLATDLTIGPPPDSMRNPFSGAASLGFSNVVLLASFDGTDAATAFSDESASAHGAFTFAGSSQLDTAKSKFGTASLLLDGSTNDFLTLPDKDEWNFGSGDFTVEAHINFDVLPSGGGIPGIVAQWISVDNQQSWILSYGSATNSLSFSYTVDGSTAVTFSSVADDGFVVDIWHHVAASRSGDNLRLFVDGVLVHTQDVTGVTFFNSSTNLVVGAITNTGGNPLGEDSDVWIDELRLTKGLAHYTATFTAPTVAHPRSAVPQANFPMASGFYQQRQVYGGTVAEPDKSWYTQTGLTKNLNVSVPLQPNDAITASLASQDVQEIRHYIPISRDLLVFTNSAEWRITSQTGSGFSVDTIEQNQETNWGSSHLVPVVVGRTVVFVEEGKARLRSIAFALVSDGFDTADLNTLAPDLLNDLDDGIACERTVLDWTYEQFPESRFYIIGSDGTAMTMTFDEAQEVVAWTTWDTLGQFYSCTTLRRGLNSTEDAIYFLIKRWLADGSEVNYIERLASRRFRDVRDAVFLDLAHEINNPIDITAVTKADSGVFTANAHGLSDGDEIELAGFQWQPSFTEIKNRTLPTTFNNLKEIVANKTIDTFELLDRTIEGGGDWDISSAEFNVTSSLSGELPLGATDWAISSDGLKGYTIDGAKTFNADVSMWLYEYDLGVAYDIGTRVYNGNRADLTTLVSVFKKDHVNQFDFTTDGTQIVFLGAKDHIGSVFVGTLSSPWDVTTLTINVEARGLLGAFPGGIGSTTGVTLNSDATRMYVATSTAGIYEYTCNLAAIALMTRTGSILDVATTSGVGAQSIVSDVYLRDSGTQLFVSDSFNSTSGTTKIHEYSLDPKDILGTATFVQTLDLGTTVRRVSSIAFKETDGAKMYLTRYSPQTVFQFDLTVVASTTSFGKAVEDLYMGCGEVRKTNTVLSSLACLDGMEVKLFLDGNVECNQTVANSELTVDDGRTVARAVIGLPYTCDIELLDIEKGSTGIATDTLQGKFIKIGKVVLRFFKSRMPFVGPTANKLTQIRPRQFEKFGEAGTLVSGDAKVTLKPDWNSNGRLLIRQTEPVPLTILAVFPNIITEDEIE